MKFIQRKAGAILLILAAITSLWFLKILEKVHIPFMVMHWAITCVCRPHGYNTIIKPWNGCLKTKVLNNRFWNMFTL